MPKIKNTLKEQIKPEEQAIKDILRENIKKYRQRRNLSQFALASKVNISTNFLADIEAGNTWVSAQTLSKLAKAFEIEAYELLKPDNQDLTPEEQTAIDQSKKIKQKNNGKFYQGFSRSPKKFR